MHSVLVCHFRTGSSWVSGYARQSPWTHKLWEMDPRYENIGSEYFAEFDSLKDISIQQRIDVLKDERSKGKEYYLKIQIPHMLEDYHPIILDFYKDFYKNTNKIKLYNRDAWRVFLSWSYQEFHKWFMSDYYHYKEYKALYFRTTDENLEKFAKTYSDYIKFDIYDEAFNYHNLTEDFLQEYFCTEKYKIKMGSKIDNYENYLLQDPNELKNKLYQLLKNNGLHSNEYVL